MAVPRAISLEGQLVLEREAFFAWMWEALPGLAGIDEGTVLADALDVAEAPVQRDWISDQDMCDARAYFYDRGDAEKAMLVLKSSGVALGIQTEEEQDWLAQWKATVFEGGHGIDVPPWKIVPPWYIGDEPTSIRINPGAGFGTGTHPTTQLCLEFLGTMQPVSQALDFGSGSGILSIALARRGTRRVLGVEIDASARENARENAALNQVNVVFQDTLPDERFQVIVANILRSTLLEYAATLVAHLDPSGVLVLSGLLEQDMAPVLSCYRALLPGCHSILGQKEEWFAVLIQARP